MSDTITNESTSATTEQDIPALDQLEVPKVFNRPDPHIKWPAKTGTDLGDFDALDISVPITLGARVDIWKVPVSEASPEGYWVSVNNTGRESAAEPGVESWNKHLICRIQMTGNSLETNIAEVNPRDNTDEHNSIETDGLLTKLGLELDMDALNPIGDECLNYLIRTSVTGVTGTEHIFDGKFGGTPAQSTTVTITPTECSITGLAGHPDVLNAGETYSFITTTADAANAEIANAKIITTTEVGDVTIVMTPGLTKVIKVNGRKAPVDTPTDDTGLALDDTTTSGDATTTPEA